MASDQELHDRLIQAAADIANKNLPDEYKSWGPIFAPVPSTNTLSLTVQNGMPYIMTLPDREKRVKALRKLAAKSVKEALLENRELVAGLIVGYARQGENYFDRYSREEPQQLGFDI